MTPVNRCLLPVRVVKKPCLETSLELSSIPVVVSQYRRKVVPHSWRSWTVFTARCYA